MAEAPINAAREAGAPKPQHLAADPRLAPPHSLTLSETQLEELTGLRQPCAQIRWLHEIGWTFVIRANGTPAVALDEFRAQMCTGGKRERRRIGPNLARLDRVG